MEETAYITKEIAAGLLGLSSRRVLELADAGKIAKRESYNPDTKRRQTILLAADVKRLAAQRQPGTALVGVSAPSPQSAATPETTNDSPAFLPHQWLTVAEAAQYTRLPESIIVIHRLSRCRGLRAATPQSASESKQVGG